MRPVVRPPTIVGSFNPYQRSNNQRANAAVREFVQLVGVGGLQEYGGPVRRDSLDDLADLGVSYFKPKGTPSAPAIFWHDDRFRFMRGRTPLVARGRHVGHVPGRRAVLPDLHGSVVVLWDQLLDTETVVANLHTTSHVEFWPGPRRRMYRQAVAGLVDDMHLRFHPDRPAYLLGDWNWDLRKASALPRRLLRDEGLISSWAGNPSARGSHGKRLIDGVFAREFAESARVLARFDVGDHDPVIAVYRSLPRR